MIERRALGRTGLTVSAVGFGCGAVGGLMVKGEPAAQRRAIARAIAAGIRYFDTARSYGDGVSEQNLGRVLGELGIRADDERVVVGTKFRLEPPLTDAYGEIRASLEGSLRRLGRPSVHLFQLHNQVVSRPNGRNLTVDQVVGPVADALIRLRTEGLIGHAGITAMGETAAVHQVVASGRIATAQVFFNAANPSAGYAGRAPAGAQEYDGLIDRCAEHGVGVINIRPLAAGALTGTTARHPNAGGIGGTMGGTTFEQDLARATRLPALAREADLESQTELAFRFVLGKPGVSTVIVGLSDESQLEDAIRWGTRGPLPADLSARLASL